MAQSVVLTSSLLAVGSVTVAADEPLLKAPVRAGISLEVIHGYNDPPPGSTCSIGSPRDHCENQRYGLDLQPVGTDDRTVLAPMAGSIEWEQLAKNGCIGMATPDGLNLNLCHFATLAAPLHVPLRQGDVIGTRSTGWIHLSLDDPSKGRAPVPLTGRYALEGRDLPPTEGVVDEHNGEVFMSTNRPSGASTATGPSGKPLSRPAALPARVPWSAGQAHSLISSYDTGSPEGFGLLFSVASPDTVYPVYPGEVIYAGCATGRSAPLGRMVVVRRTIGDQTFDTAYGHLVSIDGALNGASLVTPKSVGVNQPLGTIGSLTGSSLGACPGLAARDRLYVGVLRGATVSPAGEISGGRPVYAEPTVGRGAYEGFTWWTGPATAADLADGVGEPWGRWAKTSAKDGAVIPFGNLITLSAEVRDSVPLKELRFTAYYKGWPRANSAARLDGFSETKTWRILAVCRPPGVGGEPAKTRGCRWDGTATDAVVTFEWDPTLPVTEKVTPWQPLTTVAISEGSDACVPVTFSFDLFDHAGYRRQAPGGVKKATRCPADVASTGSAFVMAKQGEFDAEKKTAQQDRWAYLMPPLPAAAPVDVQLEHLRISDCPRGVSYRIENRGCCPGDFFFCDFRYRLTWDEVPDATRYRIYVADVSTSGIGSRCQTRDGRRVRLLATVSADHTAYEDWFTWDRGDVDSDGPRVTGAVYYVTSENQVGESVRSRPLRVVFRTSWGC